MPESEEWTNGLTGCFEEQYKLSQNRDGTWLAECRSPELDWDQIFDEKPDWQEVKDCYTDAVYAKLVEREGGEDIFFTSPLTPEQVDSIVQNNGQYILNFVVKDDNYKPIPQDVSHKSLVGMAEQGFLRAEWTEFVLFKSDYMNNQKLEQTEERIPYRKEEPTFYVNENSESPILGDSWDNMTGNEAMELYTSLNNIPVRELGARWASTNGRVVLAQGDQMMLKIPKLAQVSKAVQDVIKKLQERFPIHMADIPKQQPGRQVKKKSIGETSR